MMATKFISRREFAERSLLLTGALNSFNVFGFSSGRKQLRSDWMVGKWGMMVHWIAPGPAPERGSRIEDLNKAVNAFNVLRFLNQFQQSGADFLMFTIGQNTGYYASPNNVLDQLVGEGHASKRDLILELAKGVHALKKKFIAYLPGEIAAPKVLHEGFAWNRDNQAEFQKRYTQFIKQYSLQYGKYLDGWWFDGCYTKWPEYYIPRDWDLWLNASRAGNSAAVVAFNDGCFYVGSTQPPCPQQDYLSGEAWKFRDGKIAIGDREPVELFLPTDRFVPGTSCQFHVQLPIDCDGQWMHNTPGPMPPPHYTDQELFPVVKTCLQVGGTVTLNMGIYQEGHIAETTLAQLQRMKRQLS